MEKHIRGGSPQKSKQIARKAFVIYILDLITYHWLVDYFQGQTMQMMYEIIAKELKSMNLMNVHPQDYLNFYCLGNREKIPDTVSCAVNKTSGNGEYHTVIIQSYILNFYFPSLKP